MPRTSHRNLRMRAAVDTEVSVADFVESPQIDEFAEVKKVEFLSLSEDGIFKVAGEVRIPAPAHIVYGVLADYQSCARVFNNILDSKVEQSPHGELLVKQKCRWSFLAFSGSFDCSLAVTEDPNKYSLVFKLLESSFMRYFEGSWRVIPLPPSGQQQQESCVVQHVLSVKPMMQLPKPIAQATKGIFVNQVSNILDDLMNEIDRSSQ